MQGVKLNVHTWTFCHFSWLDFSTLRSLVLLRLSILVHSLKLQSSLMLALLSNCCLLKLLRLFCCFISALFPSQKQEDLSRFSLFSPLLLIWQRFLSLSCQQHLFFSSALEIPVICITGGGEGDDSDDSHEEGEESTAIKTPPRPTAKTLLTYFARSHLNTCTDRQTRQKERQTGRDFLAPSDFCATCSGHSSALPGHFCGHTRL